MTDKKTLEERMRYYSDIDFDIHAEPNPFYDDEDEVTLVCDIDELLSLYGMDDFVRGPGKDRGLENASRARRGKQGVYKSVYNDLVRDVDDLASIYIPPHQGYSDDIDDEDPVDPENSFFPQKDDLYLDTKDYSYYNNEFNDPSDLERFFDDEEWRVTHNLNSTDEEDEEDQESSDFDSENEEDSESEEARYDGIVRSIQGAYLVSKKQRPDETYQEVWMYTLDRKLDRELEIKNSILSGTDIDPRSLHSEDGSQQAILDSVGNVQFLTLIGLPD